MNANNVEKATRTHEVGAETWRLRGRGKEDDQSSGFLVDDDNGGVVVRVERVIGWFECAILRSIYEKARRCSSEYLVPSRLGKWI